MNPKKTKTFLGFPLSTEENENSEVVNSPKERGIALLISLIIIMMLMMFTTDMIVTSSVELKLAAGKRDEIKAEYLAKSGIHLSTFLILADLGVDLTLYKTVKAIPSDGSNDIWDIDFLQNTPIGPSAAKFFQSGAGGIKLSKVIDSKVFDQLNLFDGDFTISIEDEASKININECAVGKGIECLNLLNGLMSCPAESHFLTIRRKKGTELAAHIKDWADFRNSPAKGAEYSHEDDPYDRKDSGQKPKNDYFDSVNELLQVEGWNSDVHSVFSPYLTVYPIPSQTNANNKKKRFKININSAKRELVSCLLKTYNGCEEKAAIGSTPIGGQKPKPVNTNKGIESKLSQVYCDKEKKKWFTFRSDVYRIKAKGEVGDTIKKIETVVHRRIEPKKNRKLSFDPVLDYLYWNSR